MEFTLRLNLTAIMASYLKRTKNRYFLVQGSRSMNRKMIRETLLCGNSALQTQRGILHGEGEDQAGILSVQLWLRSISELISIYTEGVKILFFRITKMKLHNQKGYLKPS